MTTPPSGVGGVSLIGVGGGEPCERQKFRGAGGGGEPCERIKVRRAGGGGSNSVFVASIDGKPSTSTRWIPHTLFPRLLDQRSLLTLNVRSNPVTHDGEVFW